MHPEPPTRSAAWRLPGLVALAAIAIGGFAYAASAREVRSTTSTTTYPAARTMKVRTATGTTIIRGGERADIAVGSRVRYTGAVPDDGVSRDGDTLTVEAGCGHGWFSLDLGGDDFGLGAVCDVRQTIDVPAATLLDVGSGTGDVRVTGTTAARVQVETGTGDVTVAFAARPSAVTANSGTGDVVVRVPAGAYRLQLDSGTGDVHVAAGIVDDPAAPSSITVGTGTGDVAVERSDV